MIIIILVICILTMIIGAVLIEKDFVDLGCICELGGIVALAISIVVSIGLTVKVKSLSTIDAKIEMYQQENTKIEQQIANVVSQYQQYETEIFTTVSPESSITLVALYPELKSDVLVQKQIEVYISNNEKIKNLKEEQINGNVLRWWLYFGGEKNV